MSAPPRRARQIRPRSAGRPAPVRCATVAQLVAFARRPAVARRATLAVVLAGAALAVSAGCARAVSVAVAPDAADPVCASVVLALPAQLAQYPRLDTTSQATAAWGDPAAPIVLRCGVDPLPPTTDKCVTATDDNGTSVDWVAVEDDPDASGAARWTFTTYGREPAVEVTVPSEVTSSGSTSFLVDLGTAIAATKTLRSCI